MKKAVMKKEISRKKLEEMFGKHGRAFPVLTGCLPAPPSVGTGASREGHGASFRVGMPKMSTGGVCCSKSDHL